MKSDFVHFLNELLVVLLGAEEQITGTCVVQENEMGSFDIGKFLGSFRRRFFGNNNWKRLLLAFTGTEGNLSPRAFVGRGSVAGPALEDPHIPVQKGLSRLEDLVPGQGNRLADATKRFRVAIHVLGHLTGDCLDWECLRSTAGGNGFIKRG